MSKDQITLQLFAIPGFLMLGLGLNSLLLGDSARIHPVLESQAVGIALVILGGALALVAFKKALHVFKNRCDSIRTQQVWPSLRLVLLMICDPWGN